MHIGMRYHFLFQAQMYFKFLITSTEKAMSLINFNFAFALHSYLATYSNYFIIRITYALGGLSGYSILSVMHMWAG